MELNNVWEVLTIKTYTDTKSYSYTKTRIGVIDDHFEMFLRCSNFSDHDVDLLLKAVENKELSAIGIYIEDDGYRIAEVEFEIDWDEHQRMIGTHGYYLNVDIPGWKNGVSPEAYVPARRLVELAKQEHKVVHSWICVSPDVRRDKAKHKAVCKKLGYCFGGSVPHWKNPPIEQERRINNLQEAKVTSRVSSS